MSEAASIPGVDLDRLAEWMDDRGLPTGPITNCKTLWGGTQNILVHFERGGQVYVLRRPPLHKRDNSDETMRREARVLAALADTDVPHPRFIAGCPETDVIGASFYLMEMIDGFNATVELPQLHRNDPAIQHQMGIEMVDAIAALGAIDHEAAGLGDLGKPEGFLERQVPRWKAHLDSYAKFDGYGGPEIPGVDDVGAWLEAQRPDTFRAGIMHGDYHLANVMFRRDSAKLAAIVDWELVTIGDPLLDLGWLLATWPEPDHPEEFRVGDGLPPNLPRPDELVARYGENTTRDVSAMRWYGVLACYKLGIILEGTHARACAGKAPKEIGDLLHQSTIGLFRRAHRFIETA